MNILFIFSIQRSLLKEKPLRGQEDIQMGIAQLSSVLKKDNHTTDLLVLDKQNGQYNYDALDKKLSTKKFDVIAFTSVYSEFGFIKDIAAYAKSKYAVFTIVGGVHVTISPEDEYLDVFDALCIGEGEDALLALANKMEGNDRFDDIPNLWLKKEGRIIKNPTKEFIQNLDDLPFVDRDLWQPYIFDKNTRLTVLLGRGCPFNCSYCCNHKIKKVAPGKYVRLRSPQNIVAELNLLSSNFPDTTEYFLEVETLGADLNWLIDLCDNLHDFNQSRETKLSFGANLRVYDSLDMEVVFASLKKANFESITIGLESGNERVRREILNRYYSNDTIFKAAKTARRYGIKIAVFNLIGLPTESYSDFLDTLRMNQEIQPDWHATSIFFPYKGTVLHDMALKLGVMPSKLNFKNERQHATLNLPDFKPRQVQKQFDSFHFNVYKKSPKKSILKMTLFFAQTIMGHNFMGNAKNKLTIVLYRMNINTKLLGIIQKS